MASEAAVLDKHGRIIIPAEIRKQMGWEAGQRLLISAGEFGLTILTRKHAIQQIQKELQKRIPAGRSLVDELIRDRREEVRREDEEFQQSRSRRNSKRKTA